MPEEVITKEQLRKNIESTLRDINTIMSFSIENKQIEAFRESVVNNLMIYGLDRHNDVKRMIKFIDNFIMRKDRLQGLTTELLEQIREVTFWSQFNVDDEVTPLEHHEMENVKGQPQTTV